MATVVLVGTFDTKGAEYGWLREQVARCATWCATPGHACTGR
ncbi:Tm-1-like ATP-binding domain-containing protein [Modestobacter muralis]|nr:Tm-1-like ATP-binding domain-containing protein [Modestobacter muralis]